MFIKRKIIIADEQQSVCGEPVVAVSVAPPPVWLSTWSERRIIAVVEIDHAVCWTMISSSARSCCRCCCQTGDLVESKDVSIRGLESRTKKGSKKKKIIRINSFAAVFLELDFQKAQDFYDDEAIAEAYFKYSMPSSISAQRIGKKDESQARRCWRSPTHCYQKETIRGQAESGKRRGSRRSTRSTRTTSGHSRRSIRELQID